MKNGWQMSNLGDLCEVIGGGTPSKDQPAFYSGKIPWATVRDMRQEVITETEFRITKEAVQSSATNIIPSGNVVIATRVGLGKVCLLGQDTAINQDLRGIIPRSSKTLGVRFLFWWLKTMADVIVAEGTGATVQGVKLPFIKSLQIPVLPFAEQQRIVRILDEAFESIDTAKANAEENLQNARALFESYLESVFTQRGTGWVDSTIGEIIRFIDYRGKTPVKTMGGVRLITAKNVKMGYIQETPMEFIAPASYRGWMTRGIPQKGDVLFTTEAPLANVAQLDTDEKVAFAQRIIIMQPEKTKLDCTFLKYLLLSGPIQQRIRAKGTGATVQGIKASLLKLIEISFPKTLAEQNQIANKLDALSQEAKRLASLYERKLTALGALKKSLLHQAFTGKL
jgi:type I restriction enzyme, S subunit